MSPSKFHGSDVTKGVMNGPRPLPLRINKDSHVIHKPLHHHQPPPTDAKKRQPVIIYTHSPKVIYAQARDFMALVQTLTGPKRPKAAADGEATSLEEAVNEEDSFFNEKQQHCCGGGGGVNNNVGYVDNNETTSVLPDDQRFMGDVKQDPTVQVSPMYKMPNTFLMEAPLFTPNSSEFYCSTSSLFQPPNMAATAISPSFMDYIKAFPDY